MTDPRRAIAFWLLVGGTGFLLVPWYALQDSVFGLSWLAHFGSKEAAPAWLQVLQHGRGWLAPLGSLLGLAVLLLLPGVGRRLRSDALIGIGAAGFLYFFAQGFAIGPTGWYLDALVKALPALAGGQYGMGLGAALVVTAFAMLFSLGLAGRGFFKGDAFVAGSVVAVASLVVVFTFFPVFRILISAVEDANSMFSATAFYNRLSTEKNLGPGLHHEPHACGVAWNTLPLALVCATCCTSLGLAFALIVTRTGFRHKKILRILTVLPIITPPFVIGLGLILIFGRSGILNQLIEFVFGFQPGRWIYGMQGVLLAQVFAFTPSRSWC